MISSRSQTSWICTALALMLGAAAGAGAQQVKDRMDTQAHLLHAGPIRVQFPDGELRYLYVGDKEIVRRIYFAVRDNEWDTIAPQFQHIDVKKQEQGFTIDLEAVCRRDKIDYRWQGHIVGTPKGEITFRARGVAGSAFDSNRIGLCVLFGKESLVDQSFSAIGGDAHATPGAFPALVSPTLVASKFQTLHYKTNWGLEVATTISGTHFDMEDQRNWGDASFKAYAPLTYSYPHIPAGAEAEETVTVQTLHAVSAESAATATLIRVGALAKGSRVPTVTTAPLDMKPVDFANVNMDRAHHTGAQELTWGLDATVHLPDNANIMDNVGAVQDQVKTARSFAPQATIRIAPVRLDPPAHRPSRDPRNETLFGAAWSAAVLKYMTLAGVDRAEFQVGPGIAHTVQAAIGAYVGHPAYTTDVEGPHPRPVDAFAINASGKPVVWVINLTQTKQQTTVYGLPNGKRTLLRFKSPTSPNALPTPTPVDGTEGPLELTLEPYEVCEIRY